MIRCERAPQRRLIPPVNRPAELPYSNSFATEPLA